MGYYTTFCFNLEEGSKEQYDAMLKDINELMGNIDAPTDCCFSAKWYVFEEDLEKISKKYPDIAFSVEGDGEDFDDHWIEYWHNGKFCREELHFKSYDIERGKASAFRQGMKAPAFVFKIQYYLVYSYDVDIQVQTLQFKAQPQDRCDAARGLFCLEPRSRTSETLLQSVSWIHRFEYNAKAFCETRQPLPSAQPNRSGDIGAA